MGKGKGKYGKDGKDGKGGSKDGAANLADAAQGSTSTAAATTFVVDHSNFYNLSFMATENHEAFITQPLTPTSMVLDLGCTRDMTSRVATQDMMKFCDPNKSTKRKQKLVICMYDREFSVQSTEFDIVEFHFDLQPDKALLSSPILGIQKMDPEEPENLVFATDDEWMIDENKMELIRVHKKMRQIKYDPKDGHTPVPLEFLDTTRKTIMECSKDHLIGWILAEGYDSSTIFDPRFTVLLSQCVTGTRKHCQFFLLLRSTRSYRITDRGTELEVHTTTSSEAVSLRPMSKNVRVLTLPYREFEYCNVYRGYASRPLVHDCISETRGYEDPHGDMPVDDEEMPPPQGQQPEPDLDNDPIELGSGSDPPGAPPGGGTLVPVPEDDSSDLDMPYDPSNDDGGHPPGVKSTYAVACTGNTDSYPIVPVPIPLHPQFPVPQSLRAVHPVGPPVVLLPGQSAGKKDPVPEGDFPSHDEPPVPDADGDSDSDATVDYHEDSLLALAVGDEDSSKMS
ncbi:unnamed protein product [Symbiodinium necroappetens]|uniref:Uncharacterized protein n=1 Tax=Symbiodinium necroappetens TaxID=1628268 RepID=A0A813A9A7_9DINO|nr:unnamed protein product [Symbiodinium necroappetens]